MANDTKAPEVVDEVPAVVEVQDDKPVEVEKDTTVVATSAVATDVVVDVKDFEAVVNELQTYKERAEAEIAELREYKARQEAEAKAKDLIGLPGISDERRVELARTADDKLFEELKAMAAAVNELAKPIGVTVNEDDVSSNKEELDLRKRIKEYAAENQVTEQEAYYAVVNGGK